MSVFVFLGFSDRIVRRRTGFALLTGEYCFSIVCELMNVVFDFCFVFLKIFLVLVSRICCLIKVRVSVYFVVSWGVVLD